VKKLKRKIKYFKRELGGIVRLTNNCIVDSLNKNREWFRNQEAASMFVDGMYEYEEISEEEVKLIINKRKKSK